jgi:hypothetical protein
MCSRSDTDGMRSLHDCLSAEVLSPVCIVFITGCRKSHLPQRRQSGYRNLLERILGHEITLDNDTLYKSCINLCTVRSSMTLFVQITSRAHLYLEPKARPAVTLSFYQDIHSIHSGVQLLPPCGVRLEAISTWRLYTGHEC